MSKLPAYVSMPTRRRNRLRKWIADHCDGLQVKFIEKCAARGHHLNQGELSGLLNKKSFGEKKARSIEAMAGMDVGWLDLDDSTRAETALPHASEPLREYSVPASDWPFTRVPYSRLSALIRHLGPKQARELIDTLDQQIEATVFLWENKPRAAANGAAR